MRDVLSLILGGGRGTRLYPLTKHRSKPAVPIAGKYRLIDIPISNCINSGVKRIYILTQFLSVSLHRHIANTYKFDPFSQGFVEVLAAQQTNETADWYQGTADAVRQNLRYIQDDGAEDILILSGDQLYRMDLEKLVQAHRDSQAPVTIAVLPVSKKEVSGFGIVTLDENSFVNGFLEKPKQESQLPPLRTPADWIESRGIQAKGREFLASMGIYVFKRDALIELLEEKPLAADFGKEIFPRSIKSRRVYAHLFDGYWEDLGTIKAYHEANLALAGDEPPFDFHSPEGVIFTRMRFLPASRIRAARVERCLISDGCVVGKGTTLENCVIGVRSRIGENVTIRNSVIIGADRFETDAEREANRDSDLPDLVIGDGSVIENALVDKDCRIGRNVRIVNKAGLEEVDHENYAIREGVIVIPRGTVIPDGTEI